MMVAERIYLLQRGYDGCRGDIVVAEGIWWLQRGYGCCEGIWWLQREYGVCRGDMMVAEGIWLLQRGYGGCRGDMMVAEGIWWLQREMVVVTVIKGIFCLTNFSRIDHHRQLIMKTFLICSHIF